MDIFDTCGDAVIELSGSLVVQRLLDHLAYGCKAGELVGRSIVSCIHPNHQKAFEQTAIALLAMPSPPRAVRMLHSVFYKRSGSRAEVIVTALRPRMLPPVSRRDGVPWRGEAEPDRRRCSRCTPMGHPPLR